MAGINKSPMVLGRSPVRRTPTARPRQPWVEVERPRRPWAEAARPPPIASEVKYLPNGGRHTPGPGATRSTGSHGESRWPPPYPGLSRKHLHGRHDRRHHLGVAIDLAQIWGRPSDLA
ncbi:hypothetical protein NL676_012217 [Syzygium grande]|nr:hypothetical protein NL676_012217 [Syzygium grande]